MNTLQDAIALYEKSQKSRADETREYEEACYVKNLEMVRKEFTHLGLTPKQVTPFSVFFDYEDDVIEFGISHWKYSTLVARMILSDCPDCSEPMCTAETSITSLEDIGRLLSNREPMYHDCPSKYLIPENGIIVEQTISEKLIEVLDAYIDEKIIHASFARD